MNITLKTCIAPSIFAYMFLIIISILLIRAVLSWQNFDSEWLVKFFSEQRWKQWRKIEDCKRSSVYVMQNACRRKLWGHLSTIKAEYDCMSVDEIFKSPDTSIVDLLKLTNRYITWSFPELKKITLKLHTQNFLYTKKDALI